MSVSCTARCRRLLRVSRHGLGLPPTLISTELDPWVGLEETYAEDDSATELVLRRPPLHCSSKQCGSAFRVLAAGSSAR